MANGLLLRLRERELSASPAERNVIAYVSAHPHEVVGLPVRGLADVTFSSPSSILRFCKRLGFAGYKEFQRELIAELALLGDKKDVALEDISMDGSVERIVGKVMKSNVRTIEATARTLDYTVLERCAARLKRARAVNLFGIGASRLVAHDLAQKLMRVDKECHLYDDWHDQLLCAKNMHEGDMAIAFSYSGLTQEVLDCTAEAQRHNCPVVAVTKVDGSSKLATMADAVLGVAASEPLVRSGAMASRMAQLMVVDALYAAYVANDYERATHVIKQTTSRNRKDEVNEMLDLTKFTTEQRNQRSMDLDTMTSLQIVTTMNDEDLRAVQSVTTVLPQVATAIDWAAEALERGGRVFYMGAGTSGRLGVLDASECPPTFGVSPDLIVGLIAGGETAFIRAVEGAEDSDELGANDLRERGLSDKDLVVGLAASGRTPYVVGGLVYAKATGCKTIAIACNQGSKIGESADLAIEPVPGPEVLTGSTRLKAGTVQKLILNMISTGAMVKIGKVYQNLMVDVQQTNEKLVVRGQNIVMEATGCTRERAVQALADAGGHVKTAIVSVLLDCDAEQAAVALERARGHVRAAVSGHEKSNADAQ